mmetsp:Transcript_81160/g.160910  ORF Transcript_81160/g.160910 Transcript_81160/m.160910 type:complete len:107 (+) Transcript_81160:99-419(+)
MDSKSSLGAFLRPVLVIAAAYLFFVAFVIFVWWVAWRLSLSKVPLLRECLGKNSGGNKANVAGSPSQQSPSASSQPEASFTEAKENHNQTVAPTAAGRARHQAQRN